MPTRTGKLISSQEGGSPIAAGDDFPPDAALLGGDGDVDWKCGGCGKLLAKGMEPKQLVNVSVICPGCHATNLLDG